MKEIVYSKIKAGLYSIEPDGRVYSHSVNKYMVTKLDKDGYEAISLRNNTGGYSKFGIHRLLIITYCPIENTEEMTVNHIDGNKKNNTLENLEWVTASENTRLAHETKLNNSVGENHGRAKLTEEQAKQVIDFAKQGMTLREVQQEIPIVTKNMYNSIKHNRTWKHLPR